MVKCSASLIALCLAAMLAVSCGQAPRPPATTQPQGVMVPLGPFSRSGADIQDNAPVPVSVTVQEFRQLLDAPAKPLVLDVRSRDSYASGHIEGAVSLPLDDLDSHLSEIPHDRLVVCYCSGDA